MDANKDQSYFLCQLTQDQLKHALFPIGELTKDKVRAIAKEQDLVTAEKRDSQGLCFIGKVKLPDFLKQQLKEKEGEVIEISRDWDGFSQDLAPTAFYTFSKEDGKVIGKHQGAHFYTVGQRKGLNIGGYKNPLFILQVNTTTNQIFVGEGEDHPGLLRKGLSIAKSDIHWLREDQVLSSGESVQLDMRIRYRQPLFKAKLLQTKEQLEVVFEEPQKAVTPGQFAAWYQGEELLGSGVIE